jgi:hypothetical protein
MADEQRPDDEHPARDGQKPPLGLGASERRPAHDLAP